MKFQLVFYKCDVAKHCSIVFMSQLVDSFISLIVTVCFRFILFCASELSRHLQGNLWSPQHQLKWRSQKSRMIFPYTDLGETYSSPDIPYLPPAFEAISYALALTVHHLYFCWFHHLLLPWLLLQCCIDTFFCFDHLVLRALAKGCHLGSTVKLPQ